MCSERCVHNVASERANQKGALSFELKKKISFRKLAQASDRKDEYEESREFLERGLIL